MIASLKHARPRSVLLVEDDRMPNSELPVLVYDGVLNGDGKEPLFYAIFKANDWGGAWSDGIFGYHHFHSNAHEVLGVARGNAVLMLGGPSGMTLTVNEGDVLVLPAGTGHRRLRASPDFLVVGAYPRHQVNPDEYLDKSQCANYRNRVRAVPLPECDPLYGARGALIKQWRKPPSIQPDGSRTMLAASNQQSKKEDTMTQTARGRTQDRAKVAAGQDHEVRYEASKTGASKGEVKGAVKKAGNSRKKVEQQLQGSK